MTPRRRKAGPEAEAPSVDAWYPQYPRDWLTGQGTFTMTNQQRGMFTQLLNHAWLQEPPASLPSGDEALAKYADEPLDTWRAIGAKVRAQFKTPAEMRALGLEVPDDGRLRNPKQWRVYLDAVERREATARRNRAAAEARWGKRAQAPKAAPSPAPAIAPAEPPPEPAIAASTTSPAGTPAFAEVIAGLPHVVAWVAEKPEHEAAARRFLNLVFQRHGAQALVGFAAEAGLALQGGHGPQLTGDELRTALEDWCDTAKTGSKLELRAFLANAKAITAATAAENGRRALSTHTANGRRATASAGKLTSEW